MTDFLPDTDPSESHVADELAELIRTLDLSISTDDLTAICRSAVPSCRLADIRAALELVRDEKRGKMLSLTGGLH